MLYLHTLVEIVINIRNLISSITSMQNCPNFLKTVFEVLLFSIQLQLLKKKFCII